MVIWEEGKKTILGELEKVWCILRVFAYSSHLRAACNGLLFFCPKGMHCKRVRKDVLSIRNRIICDTIIPCQPSLNLLIAS